MWISNNWICCYVGWKSEDGKKTLRWGWCPQLWDWAAVWREQGYVPCPSSPVRGGVTYPQRYCESHWWSGACDSRNPYRSLTELLLYRLSLKQYIYVQLEWWECFLEVTGMNETLFIPIPGVTLESLTVYQTTPHADLQEALSTYFSQQVLDADAVWGFLEVYDNT